MVLEVWPQLQAPRLGGGLAEDDAVRVSDRDQHRLHRPNRGVDLDAVRLSVESGRQVGGAKGGPSDVELANDLGAVSRQHVHCIRAVDRFQLELVACPVLEDSVGGRDPQAVAALLCLRSVGIEDPHGHGLGVERQ